MPYTSVLTMALDTCCLLLLSQTSLDWTLKHKYSIQYEIWRGNFCPGSGKDHYEHLTSAHTKANPAQMSKIQVESPSPQFCRPVMGGWQLFGMFWTTTVGRSSNSAITGPSLTLNQQWGLLYPLCSCSCLEWHWRNQTGSIKLREQQYL